MNNTARNVFIGGAWPYANSSLHLGHAAALLPGDVIARYHRQNGDNVLYVSGSDCFGTPISLSAQAKGVEPRAIADAYHTEFKETFSSLGFSYDLYTRTDTLNHREVVQELFLDLFAKGLIYPKTADALYSPHLARFLPDRYVVGGCPKCGAHARGDQCESCGTPLDALELVDPKINPQSLAHAETLSDEDRRLEVRPSEQFYLRLSAFEGYLKEWTAKTAGAWRTNARTFTESFLRGGLYDRAITRDTDYGVPIPIEGYEDKRIYVWFEAVSGYLSASKLWAKQRGDKGLWKAWWESGDAIHYYVHGKDNIPFHTVLWPAIIEGAGSLHAPDVIVSSEYLSVDGAKFSKSRGNAAALDALIAQFGQDALRYYLIANGPEASDSNFSLSEFEAKVNGELIGTFGNLVHRTLSIAGKHFRGGLWQPEALDEESQELLDDARAAFPKIGTLIEAGKLRAAWKEILELAAQGNRYIDAKAPWKKVKVPELHHEAEASLAVLINLIHALARLIAPFLPNSATHICASLGVNSECEEWAFPEVRTKHRVRTDITPLYQRIELADTGEAVL